MGDETVEKPIEVILPPAGENELKTTTPIPDASPTAKTEGGEVQAPVDKDEKLQKEASNAEAMGAALLEEGGKKKSKKQSKGLTKREQRLQKVMKPLVDKCIPDRDPKIIRDSKYKATPYLAPRSNTPGKNELPRRSSKLAFTMPKVRDPEVILALRTEKMVHKLIKYMKKSWKVKLDPTQAERELVYRTSNAVHTEHPENWEELLEEREQLIDKRGESSKQRGFFCNYDMNYPFIYSLELDTPLLVFKNLPPDLKITATRWLKMKAIKDELKRRRDTFTPRLPKMRLKRPNFTYGKVTKNPDEDISEEFIGVAETFRQLCRGSKYYSSLLTNKAYRKKKENENVNFGFGNVPTDFQYGFTVNQIPDVVGYSTKKSLARM